MSGYGVILAAPPWSWKSWSAKGEGRSAKKHYTVMEPVDLCELPVADRAATDCVLFMWCISSMLGDALSSLTLGDSHTRRLVSAGLKRIINPVLSSGD